MRLVVKSLINKEVLLHDLSISSITRPTSYYRAATTHGLICSCLRICHYSYIARDLPFHLLILRKTDIIT